jgi:FkbM family methyltransferase
MNFILKPIRYILASRSGMRLYEKLSGTRVIKVLPIGIDVLKDIEYRIPNFQMKVIVDVGANIGQSALVFREKLPNSSIFSIEPVNSTFKELKRNTEEKNINIYNIGIGSTKEVKKIKVDNIKPNSLFNSFNLDDELLDKNFHIEEVEVNTLSNFCKEIKVKRINFLKIDTEGFDMEVLKGALPLLTESKIDFIEIEVSMNESNKRHVSYIDIYKMMSDLDYSIFGLYEQMQDFVLQKPFLRRVNAVFISNKSISNSFKEN